MSSFINESFLQRRSTIGRRPLAAAAIALAVLAAMASPHVRAQPTQKVNIGVSNKSLLGLPILIAKEKGFFRKEGLDAGIDYFNGGVPATAALIGGSVQYIDAALENNVKTAQQKQPIVSIMNLQTDFAGAVVVRNDVAAKFKGGAPTVKDLKGLRIGTLARGGFADVSTRYIVNQAGLDADKDVDLVPIRGADRQISAGEAGEIEAAFVMEPWNVIAVDGTKKWRYVIDITQGEGPQIFQGLSYTTLQTTKDQVKNQRATTEKVVRAVAQALEYIKDEKNLDDVAAIADREYGQPGVDIMKISLKRQARTFGAEITPASLAKTVELLIKSDSIKAPGPTFDEVVDKSFDNAWKSAQSSR